MDRRESEALDRHITGNYGEDFFRDGYDEAFLKCQVSNCEEEAEDGVLCEDHQPPEDDGRPDDGADEVWDQMKDERLGL